MTAMETPVNQDTPDMRWHIGKEIPLALVGAVILQTIFFAVWLSNLSSSVGTVAMTLAEFRGERYTREDARRDRELIEQKIVNNTQADLERVRRLGDLESRMQQVERGIRR